MSALATTGDIRSDWKNFLTWPSSLAPAASWVQNRFGGAVGVLACGSAAGAGSPPVVAGG